MNKKFIYGLVLAASMAACTDDYKDWAEPQQNAQAEIVDFGKGKVTEVASINFAELGDSVEYIKVCDITSPTAADDSISKYVMTIGGQEFSLNARGEVSYADLKAYVENTYGKRPVERILEAYISSWSVNGVSAIKVKSETFLIKVTPVAPVIDTKYYVTGSINGWNNGNTDYEVVNGGGDVYEDAVFTITIPGDSITNDLEFKLTPASGLNGDWSGCVCAAEEEGKLVHNNGGGNFKVAAVEGAKKYVLKFDMLNMTWSCEAISYLEYFYEIGGESKWQTAHALYGPSLDGKYEGFYYLDSEFKFKPNENDWAGDYEYDGEGKIADNGGSNCPAPEAGFYRINVDLGAGTYQLTLISKMSLIGSAVNGDSSWGTDYDLEYSTKNQAWEGTFTMTDGEYKIRADHAWTYSWGGSLDAMTSNSGANLSIKAGKYSFSFKPNCDGKGVLTVTPAE